MYQELKYVVLGYKRIQPEECPHLIKESQVGQIVKPALSSAESWELTTQDSNR